MLLLLLGGYFEGVFLLGPTSLLQREPLQFPGHNPQNGRYVSVEDDTAEVEMGQLVAVSEHKNSVEERIWGYYKGIITWQCGR